MENASAGLLGEGSFQSDVISRMALIFLVRLVEEELARFWEYNHSVNRENEDGTKGESKNADFRI